MYHNVKLNMGNKWGCRGYNENTATKAENGETFYFVKSMQLYIKKTLLKVC